MRRFARVKKVILTVLPKLKLYETFRSVALGPNLRILSKTGETISIARASQPTYTQRENILAHL